MAWLATIFYMIHLALSSVLMSFVVYETQGYAGPYRTVINQLVSFIYFLVRIHFWLLFRYADRFSCFLLLTMFWFCRQVVVYVTICPVGICLLRVWIGPLPHELCQGTVFVNNVIWMSGALVLVFIVGFRFICICKWKRFPQMNDNLVACFVIEAALTCGTALSVVKVYRPGRPDRFINVCTGVFHPSESLLEVKFPLDVIFALTCFLAYLAFYIPTLLKRRKIETSEQNHQQQPKTKESLLLNFTVIGILVIVTLLTSLMNSVEIDKLGEYPTKIYPFISMFVPNLLIQGFMVIKVILKDGYHIRREVFGVVTPLPNPWKKCF